MIRSSLLLIDENLRPRNANWCDQGHSAGRRIVYLGFIQDEPAFPYHGDFGFENGLLL